jgi:hypothetical protein
LILLLPLSCRWHWNFIFLLLLKLDPSPSSQLQMALELHPSLASELSLMSSVLLAQRSPSPCCSVHDCYPGRLLRTVDVDECRHPLCWRSLPIGKTAKLGFPVQILRRMGRGHRSPEISPLIWQTCPSIHPALPYGLCCLQGLGTAFRRGLEVCSRWPRCVGKPCLIDPVDHHSEHRVRD